MTKDALDNAWHIHDAQLDWTGKADAKAAFAFGIDSALVASVTVLVSTGVVFDHFKYWFLWVTFLAAGAALALSVIFATMGVAPRLRAKGAKKLSQSNFIYFGHARHWGAEDLVKGLNSASVLDQIARNIIIAADISWRKHRAVNWSIWTALTGGLCLVLYVFLSRIP
jgi:hypothetical protein